jgi:hypothetical protein
MHKTKTLLAAAVMSLTAFAGYSQTPSPTPNPNAGTFNDTTLSVPQRLQLAHAVLASGTDPTTVYYAARFMLTARPVINLLNAYPQLPTQVLADPTLSGTVTDPSAIAWLYWSAVSFTVDATSGLDNQIAYLQPLVSSTIFTPNPTVVGYVNHKYAGLVGQKASAQFNSSDYAGAIATAAPVLGWNGADAVVLTAKAKVMLGAPDVLNWAKLVYFLNDFPHTQDGINAVSSAFRALDTNLVRANQFIAFETSGTGNNPLAAVTVPQVTFLGADPATQALNAGVAGNPLQALRIAVGQFSTASVGNNLNKATALVAQWLRNIDGNLVRANAFVTAQTQGQPYTIPEISGTTGN